MTTSTRLTFILLFLIILTSCGNTDPPIVEEPTRTQVEFVTPTPEIAEVVTEEPTPIPTEPLPSPTPAGPPISYVLPAITQGEGYSSYEPVAFSISPSVPPYETSLSALANPEVAAQFNPAQQAALEANGFVVTPAQFGQLYDVYKNANAQNQPIFVTTDAMLHTYHVLFNFVLRDAEINHFYGDLTALSQVLLQESEVQILSLSGAPQEAALRNAAYFSVALSLLDPNFTPPADVAELVSAEVALIEAQAGATVSPIFGYEEDYSQYTPRGHYTRNETFERYFQAMMWFGRIGFRLQPGTTPDAIETGRFETRQAILMTAALGTTKVGDRPALAVWDRIYEPTVFFVGKADDLTIYDYLSLIQTVYSDTFNPQEIEDDTQLDQFIAQASAFRPPQIISSLVTDEQDAATVTQGFRFMGQRFVPDAYIFQQVVYDKVGTQAEPRTLPSALDVAAVLGSDRAYNLSLDLYDQGRFENYTAQIDQLRSEFAALSPEQWNENLYWGWLSTIQPLLTPVGEGYPVFMQNEAWADKDMHTFLGSWAELKHDTILYAKQSATIGITSVQPEPQQVNGYVEPRPEVFARLTALVSQTQRGLEGRGLLNDDFRTKFTLLNALLQGMTRMAEKELANQPLAPEEQNQIRNLGDVLELITSVQDPELISATDGRLAIVADVHTDPNTQQVLEQAIGDAFVIWVIAPIDGQPTLTQGGVFSYYEFPWPMADRLTDEAWQALDPKPAQPSWTQSFVVP